MADFCNDLDDEACSVAHHFIVSDKIMASLCGQILVVCVSYCDRDQKAR